jgi:Uncharacterised nucleotidyltransferase
MILGSDSIYAPETLADLARRLERFDRSHDPSELWPGLSSAARVAAAREIERVTHDVLSGASCVRVDPSGMHRPYALSIAAHTTGMGPLLGRWAEDGLVDAAPDVRSYLDAHVWHARRRSERIEHEVLPVFDALIARGITPLVLKGFATARQFFEEPGVRRMSDVDLLVDPERVDDATAALRSAGFRPLGEARLPYKQDWIGKSVDERVFSVELSDERTKWVVELHASLARAFHPGAVARLDVIRSHTDTLIVSGRHVLTLAPAATLLTLACHCSQELGSSRLLRLVEIVRVIRSERFSWDEFLHHLRQSGAARYAYPALALAESLAPGSVDARVLALGFSQSTLAARHTVKRLVPAGSSGDELGLLRQLMWMRGPIAILHRAFRFVWPATIGPRPSQVLPSWRIRVRLLRAGLLSIRAPDERRLPD